MSNEVIEMEETDWTRIEKMLEIAIKPVNKNLDELKADVKNLPCPDHSTRLTTVETRQNNGREFKKEHNKYKDRTFRVVIGVAMLLIVGLGVLNAIGFFRALAQGK